MREVIANYFHDRTMHAVIIKKVSETALASLRVVDFRWQLDNVFFFFKAAAIKVNNKN